MALKQHLITKRSELTGEDHTFRIWFNNQQWEKVQPFLNPELPLPCPELPVRRQILDILPDHSPYEREFLISGTTETERSDYAHAIEWENRII
jgi:hypothetical protein